MLLRDLEINTGDLIDSTQYEGVFRRIYDNPKIDTPTKQYADHTLRGIEGEKHRLAQFKEARGRQL
jgi:hypothetical protein